MIILKFFISVSGWEYGVIFINGKKRLFVFAYIVGFKRFRVIVIFD